MSATRVLITGGTGLLGKHLSESAPRGWEVGVTWHRNLPPEEWRSGFHPLDVRNAPAVEGLVSGFKPDIVIHTASIGSVEDAERSPERVAQVNVEGTAHVARACARSGAFLIHISSNAVFDGENPPYSEESPLKAVNRYGEIKIESERRVRESGGAWLIVRPILMYGWPFPDGRENAVTRWLAELERGGRVQAAEDVVSMPLSAFNCAETVWAAAERRLTGALHVAGADRVSLFHFAQETARVFGFDPARVIPVPSSHWTGLAPRPRDTSFVTARMEQALGVRPVGIAEGLAGMLRSRVPSSF